MQPNLPVQQPPALPQKDSSYFRKTPVPPVTPTFKPFTLNPNATHNSLADPGRPIASNDDVKDTPSTTNVYAVTNLKPNEKSALTFNSIYISR